MTQDQPSACIRVHTGFVVALVCFSVLLAALTVAGVLPIEAQQFAVRVNGDTISAQEVEDTYAQLPAEYQQQFSKQQVVEQIIDKTLILQEAERSEVIVSDEEVEAFIDEQVASFGISRKQLIDTLLQGGISLDEYRVAVREEMTLRAYVEEVLVANIEAESVEEQQALAAQAFDALLTQLRQEATITYGSGYSAEE